MYKEREVVEKQIKIQLRVTESTKRNNRKTKLIKCRIGDLLVSL